MRKLGLLIAVLLFVAQPVWAQTDDLPPVDADEQRELARQILNEINPSTQQSSSTDQPDGGTGESTGNNGDVGDASADNDATGTGDSGESQQNDGAQPTPTPDGSDSNFNLGEAAWLRNLMIALLVGLAAFAAWKLAGRRIRSVKRPTKRADARPDPPPKPKPIEDEASAAARRGEFERAIRLRFQAGLLRLEQQGTLTYRKTLTTGEVAAVLADPTFDPIATSFDAVAYGARPASEDDYRIATETWPRVIHQAKAMT